MAQLPREVILWINGLDLAYSIRNVRRDLSNGFIIAEILSKAFPKELNIYQFYNSMKISQKLDNWDRISKCLRRHDFMLTKEEYEPIVNYAPDSAFKFLSRLYEYFTGKKFIETAQKPPDLTQTYHYLKPTASLLSRDRELGRIVNEHEKRFRTEDALARHKLQNKLDLEQININQYIYEKKQKALNQKLMEQQQRQNTITKAIQVQQAQAEPKEIKLQSMNSSTSKKTKEAPTTIAEARGVVEYLNDTFKDMIEKDIYTLLSKSEIEINESDKATKMPIQIAFSYAKDISEVSQDAMNSFIDALREQIPEMIGRLDNSYSDFKRFFALFMIPLTSLYYKSVSFLSIVGLVKAVGLELLKNDPASTQSMFESIALGSLVDLVIKVPNKREALCGIFYSFCNFDAYARYKLLRKLKEKCGNNAKIFISLLSILVSFEYEEDFSDELYNYFFYYALLALEFPSPITKAQGLKIFSEILHINFYPVLENIYKFENLIKDSWWEVKSLILIICSSLLLYLYRQKDAQNNPITEPNHLVEGIDEEEVGESPNASHSESKKLTSSREFEGSRSLRNQEQGDFEVETNFLFNIVNSIFNPNQNQNILKVGLIYLATVLNKYPELCDRYLNILLVVTSEIRNSVLEINPNPGSEEGTLVLGSNTFKYKLTGAPLMWNSVGIAESIERFVQAQDLMNLDREHVEILAGCLVQQPQPEDRDTWFRIYENLKSYIFVGLCDRDLCSICGEILKKFLTFEAVQDSIMENSRAIFSRTLNLIYHPDTEQACKENLLSLLEYLQGLDVDKFKEYNYETLKDFSEKNKSQFFHSNLVDFMNSVAKDRRAKLFGDSLVI